MGAIEGWDSGSSFRTSPLQACAEPLPACPLSLLLPTPGMSPGAREQEGTAAPTLQFL